MYDDEEITRITTVPLDDLVSGRKKENNEPYLIVLNGTNVGEMFRVGKDEVVIGRSKKADIVLLDDGISRQHCRIVKLPGGEAFIEDLDSTNGTYINGTQIKSHILKDGDKIQVGSTTILKFSYHDALEEEFQRKLYESALRDGLTKIYNKRYFSERIESEFAYAIRHQISLSLFMMDIDHFKSVNDTYGHLAGDAVLSEPAQRIQNGIRSEDVFARYGGEEFALISRGITEEHAILLGERLRRIVADRPFDLPDGTKLTVTISIGVAALPLPDINSSQDLVDAADRALYEAKHQGRNRVIGYSSIMDQIPD